MIHGGCHVISLSRNERRFVVGLDVTNGNHMLVGTKPISVFIASSHDELFKRVMGEAENISEIHDLGWIGLAELNADLGLEF